MVAGPRYKVEGDVTYCLDCGLVVGIISAHTRFHSILSGHAWALAVLKTSHASAFVHEKYNVIERIDSKKFDSWSAEALDEVIAGMTAEDMANQPIPVYTPRPGGPSFFPDLNRWKPGFVKLDLTRVQVYTVTEDDVQKKGFYSVFDRSVTAGDKLVHRPDGTFWVHTAAGSDEMYYVAPE